MKKIILPLLVITISIISCKKVEQKAEISTDEKASNEIVAETMPDSTAIAKAWESYATPGEAHIMLAKDTGVWDAEMSFFYPNNPEPQKANSEAEYKMIFDGKYQEGIFKGDMWGMTFEGKGITAYDNATKEYIATWIDNMGTGMIVSRGKFDKATNSITFKGTSVDPVTGKNKDIKEVITYIDENTQKMEMFDVDSEGKEFKNMEILSKRRN